MNEPPSLVSNHAQQNGRFHILNTADAAVYVGLKKGTLEKLRIYGDGPTFVKPSTRVVRYLVNDLDDWLARHRVRNTSELG